MSPAESERVGFEPGPHHCDYCRATFQETPWAFPLQDLSFPKRLRFCTERCLEEYAKAHRVTTQAKKESP